MRVETHILPPSGEMPATLRTLWETLRADDERFASPYFHPDYVRAVARTSPGPVRVAVEGDRALFAFQGRRLARPAGAPMTDYHGILGTPSDDFLAQAGIAQLQVNGWVGGCDLSRDPVCRIDLSGGWQAWRDTRDSSYSRHAKSHRRRTRKAREDMGEPRARFRVRDMAEFDRLIDWKRTQFAETGKYDVLGGWPQDLLRDLFGSDGELRVDLHSLHFGDRPAAYDLGLTDGTVFHSWMVAYDPDLASYGAGIQLLEALVEAAPSLGYTTLDLGQGLDGYKRHYNTSDADVGTGVIATRGLAAGASRLYGAAEERAPALGRLRRRYSQIAACEPRLSGRLRAMGQAVKAKRN